MAKPLVSAIIIFLNGEPFLAEAIESICAQTYPHWELLLVDDGSTDGSAAICHEFATQHPDQIRYLHHPNLENRGMSASRNLGIAEAQGDFVAFLDADDLWLPHKLAEQVAIMNEHPTAGMVYGRTQIWHSWTNGDETADFTIDLGVTPNQLFAPPSLFFTLLENKAQTPTTCNALMRRDVMEQVGRFESQFRGMYEDIAFFAKVELLAPVYVADAVWACYRQHPDSSHSNEDVPWVEYYVKRRSFLEWLAAYVEQERVGEETAVYQSVQAELWRSRHPYLSKAVHQLKMAKWHLLHNLARKKLRPILAHWGIEQFIVQNLGMGASKTNWLIETADGKFVLRNAGSIYHYVDFQLNIMRHLADENFDYATPHLQQTLNGGDHIQYQENIWLLYRFIEGEPLSPGSLPELARERGALAAHLHRSLRLMPLDNPEAYALPLFCVDQINQLFLREKTAVSQSNTPTPFETQLLHSVDRILAAYNKIATKYQAAAGELDVFPIYNDWHGNNILTQNGKVAGLIDFDSVTTAPRIVDFQNGLLYTAGMETGLDKRAFTEFVQGYITVCPLTEDELSLIYPVMMDRTASVLADILDERMSTQSKDKDEIASFLLTNLNWLIAHEADFAAQLTAGCKT